MRIIIAINVISNATEIVDDCGLAYLKEEDANSNSVRFAMMVLDRHDIQGKWLVIIIQGKH